MSVENIKWPEKRESSTNDDTKVFNNPFSDGWNAAIDACKKAVASQQSTASEVPSREVPSAEICICAAINVPGLGIIRGHRHSDCIHAASVRGYKDIVRQEMQGFVTSTGRFVSRNEGALLQIDAGLKDKSPTRSREEERLFSEDLY